jgi:alpha-amylase
MNLRIPRPVLVLALLLWAIRGAAQTNSADFWRDQSIYQIITDRFFDGDPSNNNADGNFDPAGSRGTSVHGGDFKGIEQKLDYIQALGATAIWISPIVVNARGEFHGYAGRDFYKIDPHWGTLDDLRRLVNAAHARGLLVIDDIVVNHGGDLIDSGDGGYPNYKAPPDGYGLRLRNPERAYPPPFNLSGGNPALTNLFHNQGHIRDYGDPRQVELGELSGLDDLRTENPYVRGNMAAIYAYWIKEAGFDGFRIDTVKHVEMGFWTNWCAAIRAAVSNRQPPFFMFGEVLDASDSKCASYTGPALLDSVLDYPLYFKTKDVFARATGNTRQIEDRFASLARLYPPGVRDQLVTFLDNHDQPRFLSPEQANGNQDRLRVALAFLYTSKGIPCLYYGTEQGFDGGNDPYDREDMFAGRFEQGPSRGDNFDMSHPLFQWVATLNALRRAYPALRNGAQSNVWSNPQGPGLLAYWRCDGATDPANAIEDILVVLNTADSDQTLPPSPSRYPAGTKLINLLNRSETITVVSNGVTPSITLPPASAKLFVAASRLRPLEPLATMLSPKHDAADVSRACAITLRFSEAMDTNSVEQAFVTVPSVPGSFRWSAGGAEVTFNPKPPGYPATARVMVRVGASARAADSGKHPRAAFEARFTTASAPD